MPLESRVLTADARVSMRVSMFGPTIVLALAPALGGGCGGGLSQRMQSSTDEDVSFCRSGVGESCFAAGKRVGGLDELALPDGADGVADIEFASELFDRACALTDDGWASHTACIFAAVAHAMAGRGGNAELLDEGCHGEEIAGACYQLGRLRRGPPSDDAELIAPACDRGLARACVEIAEIALVVPDLPESVLAEHFGVACRAGDGPSCMEAGRRQEALGQGELALRHYRMACGFDRTVHEDACRKAEGLAARAESESGAEGGSSPTPMGGTANRAAAGATVVEVHDER